MSPKLYGPEHLIYLACFVVLSAAVILITIFVCKTEKQKRILIKSVAGVLLVSIVANRISLAVWDNNGIGALELLPNTYCGMTSLLLGIFGLIGKPHDKAYDFLFYIELVGGSATVFYANFLGQSSSFMFFPTFSGMFHHSVGVLLCILLCICGWFSPSLERWKMFPAGMTAYTIYGLFLYDVLHIPYTMQIDTPIIPNTPLKWWFILFIGSAALFVFLFIYDRVKKYVAAKKATQSEEKEEIDDVK